VEVRIVQFLSAVLKRIKSGKMGQFVLLALIGTYRMSAKYMMEKLRCGGGITCGQFEVTGE
jgi:hypothetical protein